MWDDQFGEDLARARRRYSEALPILWNPPSVVGVAIGQRVRGGETIEDEVCFVAYVREKRGDLARWEALPKELFGVPVDVQVAEGALERRAGVEGRIWGN